MIPTEVGKWSQFLGYTTLSSTNATLNLVVRGEAMTRMWLCLLHECEMAIRNVLKLEILFCLYYSLLLPVVHFSNHTI